MAPRTILHLDMNSFFASVEQAANPLLRGKPIAVGGGVGGKRSIVAACSYEAKAKGVKNAMPAWEALKLCPDLIIIAGDMSKYIHTSNAIMRMLRQYTPQVEVFSIDEAFLDITGTQARYGGPAAIAKLIKGWIRENFHLTCSIGIGPNKLMSKLAGELKKPDALIILRPEDIPAKIEKVKVSELCGVGQKLEIYLGEMGVKTFGDLNRCPRERLVKRFGAAGGDHLWQMGQGKDDSPVLPYYCEEDAKSMGHSYTLPKLTADMEEVKGYLLRLAEQVGRRLRRGRAKGNIIHVSLGFAGYKFWGKQRKFEDYLDDGYEIYKIAEKLISGNREVHSPVSAPIRFVGITVSGLIHNTDQISLIEQKEAGKKVIKAVDEINDRWGESTVERAAVMETVLHKKTGFAAKKEWSRAGSNR